MKLKYGAIESARRTYVKGYGSGILIVTAKKMLLATEGDEVFEKV